MESRNCPDDGKEESPSQENIGHLQSMKRDVESLEDFEDITKDVPSMRDATAQFLMFETGNRNKPPVEESLFQLDDHFKVEPKKLDSPIEDSPDKDFFDNFSDQKFTDSPKHQSDIDNLLQFEQSDFPSKKSEDPSNDFMQFEQNPNVEPISNVLEDKIGDVHSNDEISTGSEDLSFIPKKGESSPLLPSDIEKNVPKKPVSDSRSNETTDSAFNSQPLSKFTSEPGMKKQEPEVLQGDGLHVRDNDIDTSDNEDFVPEPIPKDYPEIGTLEGKQILAALGLDTWFHPDMLNPKIESLVYWRDPKKSGLVFSGILVILLSLTSFSLISVIAYTSLTALAAAFVFRLYKNIQGAVQKTSEGHPFKTYIEPILNHPIITAVFFTIKEFLDIDLTVNPDKGREIADVVVSHVNKSLTEFRRLFLIEDVVDSAKFGICLWTLTYVGSWFNGLSLIIIAFVGLFTLPKVYENNKTQIDANIDIVKTKINEVTEKIRAVIPMGKKTEEVKDKGE